MKSINEKFEDKEFEFLKKQKNGLSWHDYIMLLAVHGKKAIKKGDLVIN